MLCETMDGGGPYGMGWPAPRVVAGPFRAIKVDVVGNGHVRAIIAGDDGRSLKAMAFRSADTALGQALLAGAVAPQIVACRAAEGRRLGIAPGGRTASRRRRLGGLTQRSTRCSAISRSARTTSIARARFYEPVMATFGIDQPFTLPHALVFGDMMGTKLFVGPPFDGGAASTGNGTHAAFLAPDRAAVDAFHAAALANGGSDEGRARPAPALSRHIITAPMSAIPTATSCKPFATARPTTGLTIRAALPNRLAAPAMAPSSSG